MQRCVLGQHVTTDLTSLGQLWAWQGKHMQNILSTTAVKLPNSLGGLSILQSFYHKKFCEAEIGALAISNKRPLALALEKKEPACWVKLIENRIREKMTQNTNFHSSVAVGNHQSIQLCQKLYIFPNSIYIQKTDVSLACVQLRGTKVEVHV